MKSLKNYNTLDRISLLIITIAIVSIVFILIQWPPEGESKIYLSIGLIGSIASTCGLVIAILQIRSLQNTNIAIHKSITKTEKELAILSSIESASDCYNQMNQIENMMEENHIESIKILLPFATKNFHDMSYFKGFDLEGLFEEKTALTNFLENFASKLTIISHQRLHEKMEIDFSDAEIKNISKNVQKIKEFANKYQKCLQQETLESIVD